MLNLMSLYRMNIKNFRNISNLIFYYLSRPLVQVNLLFNKFSSKKPNILKKVQYKIILSIIKKKNCKRILEFGSGASTLFFLKNLDNINFCSVNLMSEKKYTDKVRKILVEENYQISKVNILDLETNIKKLNNNLSIEFKGGFDKVYDFIYIDGPSMLEGTNLIYNILNHDIKSLNYFFDGRVNNVNILISSLKKKKISYNLKSSAILNYSYINIADKNFIKY